MSVRILVGGALARLRELPAESVQCVVTSPPYWGLRDYGNDGGIGLEGTLAEHIEALVAVFREVRRVLRPDGTLWLNYGDGYSHGGNGSRDPEKWPKQSRNDHRVEHSKATSDSKPKDLLMLPARVALALQADGWWVRSEIVWHKPNPMPESVTDRPTSAHEKVYLLTKAARYFYDADAVRVPQSETTLDRFKSGVPRMMSKSAGPAGEDRSGGLHGPQGITDDKKANLRNVWTIPTQGYREAHFATFPEALVRPCIAAGSAEGDTVMDPFAGSGTVGLVAAKMNRSAILIELNPEYAAMAERRIRPVSLFGAVTVEGGTREPPPTTGDKQAGHGPRHAGFNQRWRESHP